MGRSSSHGFLLYKLMDPHFVEEQKMMRSRHFEANGDFSAEA